MIKKVAVALFVIGLLGCEQEENNEKPEDNRFTVSVLTPPNTLDEPMAFTFINEEEMLIAERKGGIKHLNVKNQFVQKVAEIPVNIMYTNKEGQSRPAEEGLIGIIADPNYKKNKWIYLMYAHPDEHKHVVARYEFRKGFLIEETKKVLLEFPVQREECCHTGGGMVWDDQGNLFITTGNNTVNPPAGTSNLDERPGFENSDDQRTAGNTNDLRGKILRIHPEADGSYTIPEGNLFPEGQAKTRPEIYTMGHRNPWRVSRDSKTGYIYWGEVGPDASEDIPRGPRGYDEFNQAKEPGFFGWPYFIGDNQPYVDFDYADNSLGKPFEVNNVVNTSVNNTGMDKLPAPQGAMLWYPYAYSEEFPLMGSAGRSATGGPVFRKADFPASDNRYPGYFEGKWLIVEFMRGWIMSVTMDENSDYVGMEPFLPEEKFISAIDMQFGPNGDLYVLEYGSAWFQGNDNASVKRVRFNGGNREPIVKASADQLAGAVPLSVQLSSEGTMDYDGDALEYSWYISSDNGFSQTITDANPAITLDQPGSYQVQLNVEDKAGNENQISLELQAGNAPPQVGIEILSGNESFFFPGSELQYEISVADAEDGTTTEGTINAEQVAINFDYAPEGFDPIEIAQNHVATDEWITFSRGKTLISESDCFSCHKIDTTSIGPSYIQVAQRYKNDPAGRAGLPDKIINGGVGVWGDHGMSAHPEITQEQAEQIVEYIMTLNDPLMAPQDLSIAGTFKTEVPANQNGKGGYLLRAAYRDQGNAGIPSLSAEKIIALRNPVVGPETFDHSKGTEYLTTPGKYFYIVEDGGYIGLDQVDLTGVKEIFFAAEVPDRVNGAGGTLEIHLDSPDGPLLGSTGLIKELEVDINKELEKAIAKWEAGGKKGNQPNWWGVKASLRPTFHIPVDGISEKRNIYIVGSNPNLEPGQKLLQLYDIVFVN